MLYAGEPESPPIGTILRDANGRQLRHVIGFDPVTGEVIDCVLVNGDIIRRHWFAPAPISFEVP